MNIVGILFVLYCFLKFFYYGLYEFREANNKIGGATICVLAVLSTIFTLTVIIYIYIL